MTVEERVPLGRAAIGCGTLAVFVLGVALLMRPAIFSLAPPRDDSAVVVGTATEITSEHVRREVLLSRSHGVDGERDAGDGRVQVAIIVGPSTAGGIVAVNGFSPMQEACPVSIGADRLTDCSGREWTFDGDPLDAAHDPLQRFPVQVDAGSVLVDLTASE